MDAILDVLRKWYRNELSDTFPDCWVFGSLTAIGDKKGVRRVAGLLDQREGQQRRKPRDSI